MGQTANDTLWEKTTLRKFDNGTLDEFRDPIFFHFITDNISDYFKSDACN